MDNLTPPQRRAGRPRGLATRAAIVTLAGAVVVGILAMLVLAADVWLLVFAGLLLAVLLSAAADGLSHWSGMPRGASLGVTLAVVVAAVVAGCYALWPSISEQADQLATQLPAAVQDLRGWLADRTWGEWLLGRSDSGDLVEDSSVVSQATGAITVTLSGVGALLVILFVGIYVAAQPAMYHRGARRLVPVRSRERFDQVLHEIVGVLRWWLVGKLLSMALVGVLTTIGLWLLAVPLALTFGLLAAVLTFVPNFGPVLSVVPPALLALADDPRRAAYVVVLYLAIQTVESYAITPLIQRRTVSMPPALTIAAQVALGVLVGAIGVAVATPLTAAAMTAIRLAYVEDFLEGPEATDADAPLRQ